MPKPMLQEEADERQREHSGDGTRHKERNKLWRNLHECLPPRNLTRADGRDRDIVAKAEGVPAGPIE